MLFLQLSVLFSFTENLSTGSFGTSFNHLSKWNLFYSPNLLYFLWLIYFPRRGFALLRIQVHISKNSPCYKDSGSSPRTSSQNLGASSSPFTYLGPTTKVNIHEQTNILNSKLDGSSVDNKHNKTDQATIKGRVLLSPGTSLVCRKPSPHNLPLSPQIKACKKGLMRTENAPGGSK